MSYKNLRDFVKFDRDNLSFGEESELELAIKGLESLSVFDDKSHFNEYLESKHLLKVYLSEGYDCLLREVKGMIEELKDKL